MGAGYVPDGVAAGGRPGPSPDDVLASLRRARVDPDRVVLEGVHALKHAVRFGADLEVVASPDAAALHRLLASLAPDVVLDVPVVQLSTGRWRSLLPRDLPSPSLAVARRPPPPTMTTVLDGPGRIVVLEQPRHLGNLGAVVRVAAAAGAAGVLVLGDADPWHPTAVRGAAGLQFALQVLRIDRLPDVGRPMIALDGGGQPLGADPLPEDAVLLVGTERGGLSDDLRQRATRSVAIPMRAGVASLNLATAVAIALYVG